MPRLTHPVISIPVGAAYDQVVAAHYRAAEHEFRTHPTKETAEEYHGFGVTHGVLTNDLNVITQHINGVAPADLASDLQQAAARGYFEVFCALVAQAKDQEGVFDGLGAACFYGRDAFVDFVLPYCFAQNNTFRLKECLRFAGRHLTVAEKLIPHALADRDDAAHLANALLVGDHDLADLLRPYSNTQKTREMLEQVGQGPGTKGWGWLDHKDNQELAGRLRERIGDRVAPTAKGRKI